MESAAVSARSKKTTQPPDTWIVSVSTLIVIRVRLCLPLWGSLDNS